MNKEFRRSLLGALFFFSCFMLWNQWLIHTGQKPLFSFGKQAAQPVASASGMAAASAGVSTPAPGAAPTAGTTGPAAAPAATGQKIAVKTDIFNLTFDTTGGSLVGAELLKYQERGHSGQPFKLIDVSPKLQYMVQTGLIGGQYPNHLTPMTLTSAERELPSGKDELQVRFESAQTGGLKLVKTYTLKRGSYAIGVRHEVINTSAAPVSAQLYNQLVRDSSEGPDSHQFYSSYTGPAFYSNEGKYQKTKFSNIDKNSATFQKETQSGYVAMVQRYFATAWLPESGLARENYVRQQNGLYAAGQIFNLGEIQPGGTSVSNTTLFAGPQQEDVMNALSPDLKAVKDYGWLTILAQPLYWLLTQLHNILGNWGWSIVALVVLLKIAFYWFNQKSYTSMAKMRNLAPKLEIAKQRFKDDPQGLQQETMRVYREEKVNPLGGCLPILIQMPVFFALYSALSATVEMRGAPWILWVKDLSAPDPFYILPVLMTASSLLQVWLNPKPTDPTQAKMMWIMPLSFAFMFFFFPAGLVLYWFTNNLLSIIQQWLINKQMENKTA
ncbi:MAG: membrane protein insertase YidC [Brachymonas sp.]|nr:membrane protein insertase YidC [Brachymonas sp.]